jgi:hypothetical protein
VTSGVVAAQRLQRLAAALGLLAAVLLLLTALLGPSAAEPPLGPRTGWRGLLPAYALDVGPSSALVTALLVAAYLAGGAAVALGLVAVRRGARVPPAGFSSLVALQH